MIRYEDAKQAIESIFGETQGAKVLSWVPGGGVNNSLRLDDNYVFIGEIYYHTPTGYSNSLSIGTIDDRYLSIEHANLTGEYYQTSIVGRNNKTIGDYFINGAGLNWERGLNIIGWQFQINV
jgi:hypothetical protein